MLRVVLVSAAVAGFLWGPVIPYATASGCRGRVLVRNQQVQVSHVAQQKVVAVAPITTTIATVPANVVLQAPYTYSYQSGFGSAGSQNNYASSNYSRTDKLDKIEQKLDVLIRLLGGDSVQSQGVGALTVFQTHCFKCHSGENPQGEFRMFDKEGILLAKLPRVKVFKAINHEEGVSAMPKGKPKLSEEELRVVQQWALPSDEMEY